MQSVDKKRINCVYMHVLVQHDKWHLMAYVGEFKSINLNMSNVDTCVLTISQEVWTTGFTKYIIFMYSPYWTIQNSHVWGIKFKQDYILYQRNGLEIK